MCLSKQKPSDSSPWSQRDWQKEKKDKSIKRIARRRQRVNGSKTTRAMQARNEATWEIKM